MRLIDADALWKDITTRIEEYCDIADLIDIIERQPTIEPEQRWIPCSESMPTEYGSYLITEMPIGDFEIEPYVATYYPEDDEWTTGAPIKIVRRPVIAWMLLPEAWKGEQNEP